jgi:hypothetical protein
VFDDDNGQLKGWVVDMMKMDMIMMDMMMMDMMMEVMIIEMMDMMMMRVWRCWTCVPLLLVERVS